MNKSVFSYFRPLIIVLMGLSLANCTAEPEGIDLSSYLDDDDYASTAPLSLQLGMTYQGSTTTDYISFNETGTTLCEASAGSPNVTCTADVPEGQLYLSTTSFVITFSSSCSIMNFRPYRYLASISATYTPPGSTTAIDCSVADPLPAACYGGAAKQIVPSFPSYSGVFSSPTGAYTEETYSVSSANSLQEGSNRLIASDLAPANVGNTYASAAMGNVGDGYEPNSFRDYYISCEDAFGTPIYDITLIVTESDGATNDHFSFKEL